MVRIFSQFFIKKTFNSIFFLVFVLFFVFGFSHISLAKTAIESDIKCAESSIEIINGHSYLTSSSPNFNKVISKIKNINPKDYNILIVSKHKPKPGYRISISKIKIKKKSVIIYYVVKKFSNSSLTALSYPYCLIKIENLDNRKIKIKKKRLKFFPFNIF